MEIDFGSFWIMSDLLPSIVYSLIIILAVCVASLFEPRLKKIFSWIFKEAGFLVFSLLACLLSYFMFDLTKNDPIGFNMSGFWFDYFQFSGVLVLWGLLDFVVLWDFDTFDEIINKRNMSYAIFFSSFIVAGAIIAVV